MDKIENEIIVFTDGSYSKNGKSSRAGYGIYFINGELNNVSRPFIKKPITSQRAELYAIYKSLNMIMTCLKDTKKIIIYSDSEYSIKSMTIWIKKWENNLWKTSSGEKVKNLDIIQGIDKLMKKFDGIIIFNHIKAHTLKQDIISKSNEVADKLAKAGSKINV